MKKMFPFSVIYHLRTLHGLGALNLAHFLFLLFLTTCFVLSEALGLAMMVPLLSFIEAGQDVTNLENREFYWAYIIDFFGFLGVEISVFSLAAFIFVTIIMRQALFYITTIQSFRAKFYVSESAGKLILKNVLDSKSSYIQGLKTGQFLQMVDELPLESGVIVRFSVTLVGLLFSLVAYFVIAVSVSPEVAVLGIGVVCILLLLLKGFVTRGKTITQSLLQRQEHFRTGATTLFGAWKIVKLHNSYSSEVSTYEQNLQAVNNKKLENARVSATIEGLIVPILGGLCLSALVISVTYFEIDIATITIFILILLRLIPIARNLAAQRQRIAILGVKLERLVEYIDIANAEKEPPGGVLPPPATIEHIELKNVDFRYHGTDHNVLSNVNLTLKPGVMTALLGPSGGGKTTILNLLASLIKPTGGSVLVNAEDLQSYSLRTLRDSIAFVPQEPQVFNTSLRDNICYGHTTVDEDAFQKACQLAGVADFAQTLPDSYETPLGENGNKLSGGQRQRVALARIYVKNAKIILLDEPTSAVDPDAEAFIIQSIYNYCKTTNAVVVIVAHSRDTVRLCEQVAVLKQGRISLEDPDSIDDFEDGVERGLDS